MGHSQPPTPVPTDNIASNRILNGTAKQKISRAIDMIFYWVRDIIWQNCFHIFWEEERENLADYVTKHHPIWHHRNTRPIYLDLATKDIKNPKDRRIGTGRGCAGTTNPGIIQKPNNPLKEIRNPIPWKPDNPITEIWALEPNGIRSQWPIGLTVPT